MGVLSRLGLLLLSASLVEAGLSSATLSTATSTKTHTCPPPGITQRGDSVFCQTPPPWTEYVSFYLGNYVAHAATVKAFPGETTFDTVLSIIMALFFPTSGIIRGMNAITGLAIFESHSLRKAARSGALCMVVRDKDWTPSEKDIEHKLTLKDCRRRKYDVSEGGTHKSRSSIDGHTMSDVELGKLGEVCGHVGYRVSLPDWTRRTSAYWRYVDSEEVYVTNRMIHGLRRVPQGYRLAFVPRDALVSFNGDDTTCQGPNGSLFQRLVSGIAVLPLKFWKFVWHGICNVCSKLTLGSLTSSSDNVRIATGEVTHSYSLPKAIISLLQTLYASVTLYRTRADQLDRFGYASFSLTVAPYAIMSAVNLLANVVTPDYSAMYLVNSSVLREARNRDEKAFDGVVGKLIEDDSRKPAIRGLCEVVIVAKVESQGEDEASSSRYNDPISSGSSGDTNTRTLVASQSSNALRVIIKSEQTEDANLDPPETEPEQAAEQPTTPASERYKFIPEAELSPDSGPEWYLDIPACPWFLRESDNSTARALVEKWQPSHKFVRRFGGLIHAVVVVAIASLSLIIIGRISHFKPGGSSFIQRFFTMAWFSCGVVMGLSFGIFPSSRAGALRQASRLGLVFYGMLDAAPFAIYAFITRIPAKIKDPNLKFWDNSIHWHRYLRETYSWDFVDRLGTDRHPRDGDDTFSYRMRKFELFQVRLAFVTSLLFFLAPPIAGFVLVGLMIREEGTCLIV